MNLTPDEIDLYGYKSLKPDQFKKERSVCSQVQSESKDNDGPGNSDFIKISVARQILNI